MNINKMLDNGEIPNNLEIFNSFMVAYNKLNSNEKILCSVSGGSDSDIMVDLFCRIAKDKVTFVFFDTGLEYKATREHLRYLEEKYKIKIETIKYTKPIPITCRDNGQPFLSKQVSENIERLQKHNFKWEDKPYEELIEEYPNCISALKWWCNKWEDIKTGKSKFNIERNKGLKEFMVNNPPTFKISPKCCKYSKKDPVKLFMKKNDFNLNCYGVRKSEGGTRSSAYKNCFTDNTEKDKTDEYRPIFWYKDDTKIVYEKFFNVTHSKCYTHYGLKRTGCCGCPFGRDFEQELKVLETFDPNLFKAVSNIFRSSYEYTKAYRESVKANKPIKSDSDIMENQMSIDDFLNE